MTHNYPVFFSVVCPLAKIRSLTKTRIFVGKVQKNNVRIHCAPYLFSSASLFIFFLGGPSFEIK